MSQELHALWRVVAFANLILANPNVRGQIPNSMRVQYDEAVRALHGQAGKAVTVEEAT